MNARAEAIRAQGEVDHIVAADDCTCPECPVCKVQGDPKCKSRCVVEGVVAVLAQLDRLAEVWGDEGVFRRCRDSLRELTAFAAYHGGEATP